VLEVDAAEGGLQRLDDPHHLVDVARVDLDVENVDVRELLEEDPLALHHRLGGIGADVAEPEHCGAVGDAGHEVAASGVAVREVGILRDLPAGLGHARRIGQREVARRGDGFGRNDLELTGAAGGVILEGILAPDLPPGSKVRSHGIALFYPPDVGEGWSPFVYGAGSVVCKRRIPPSLPAASAGLPPRRREIASRDQGTRPTSRVVPSGATIRSESPTVTSASPLDQGAAPPTEARTPRSIRSTPSPSKRQRCPPSSPGSPPNQILPSGVAWRA